MFTSNIIIITFTVFVCSTAYVVLDGKSFSQPSAIAYDGKYYMITSDLGLEFGRTILLSSDNIYNWTQIAVIGNDSYPSWSYPGFYEPELTILPDGRFAIYSVLTRAKKLPDREIGVAVSNNNITGPYIAVNYSLTSWDADPVKVYGAPSIVNNNGELLMFVYYNEVNETDGGPLTIGTYTIARDGLTFNNDSSIEQNTILQGLTDYNGFAIQCATIHNGTYYLFTLDTTSPHVPEIWADALFVARTSDLGTAEVRKEPLIPALEDQYRWPRSCSVVKDLNGLDDLFVYETANINNEMFSAVIIQRIQWLSDGWPVLYELN